MSTSAGDVIWAGSKSATSWEMGKLKVWSVASGSPGAELLPKKVQEVQSKTKPTATECPLIIT